LLGGAAFNTVVSAVLGATNAARSPGGYTPVRSGNKPAPETPPIAALAQQGLRFFGNGSLVLLVAAAVISGIIEAEEPKAHGVLSRFISS
jgi:hypothetical protein